MPTAQMAYPGYVVRRGQVGPNVKAVQAKVGAKVDGAFGRRTERAVKRHQKRHGLTVDGQVGPKTWASLYGGKPAPRKARRAQDAERPKVVNLNLDVVALWGPLGPLVGTVGHYTAGPRDQSDKHAFELWRTYHAQHQRQGWGGIGYHYGISAAGTIVLLRSARVKGAHTALHNTGRVGVVMHGTVGDRPTDAQAKSFRWLLANAHTDALPYVHRTTGALLPLRVWGHNDLYPTSCPGAFKPMYISKGVNR